MKYIHVSFKIYILKLINMGFIHLYIGCMYSGKTSSVINEARRQISIGRKVLCINYSADTRYGDDDFIYSHDKEKISCVKATKLSDIDYVTINDCDCIMINEGQFFSDLKKKVQEWSEIMYKDVLVSGLDGDYKRRPFGQILELIPLCNEVHKASALCYRCKNGKLANFTHRLSGEKEQIVIGAKNYIPVCRDCYLELNPKIDDVEEKD